MHFKKAVVLGDFDTEKNTPFSESDVVLGSTHRKYWWVCPGQRHSYLSYPSDRFERKGRQCPYCAGKKVLSGFNDLMTTHPELAAEWHPTRNGNITPDTVKYSVRDKYWWLGKCGHEWESTVLNRSIGNGCYQCLGRRKATSQGLLKEDEKLFSELHPTKNKELEVHTLKRFSVTNVWWLGSCGHEWKTSPRNRSMGHGCHYCSGNSLLKGFNDAKTRYPHLEEYYLTERNQVAFDDISHGSRRLFWWRGGQCGHVYKQSVRDRHYYGCPYCSGKKVLAGFNDLATLHPLLAQEYSNVHNDIVVTERHHGSAELVTWHCAADGNHLWEASVSNRTLLNSGCPHCWSQTFVSQAEEELIQHVQDLGLDTTKDRKVLNGKELDIYIPERQFAIEYNGVYWHSETQGKDKWYHYRKWSECKQQGIQLFTIWEDDYVRNPDLVKRMVAHKLGLSSDERIPARKTLFERISGKEASIFLEQNHLQGAHKMSRHYGLRSAGNEIIAVMSVQYKRKFRELEISRFAVSVTVVGGFSKLLTNVLRENNHSEVKKLVSYSHNDHSDGRVYENLGFTRIHSGVPNYFYVVNGVRKHRLNYSSKRFRERANLLYEEGLTERELAALNGYERIWDCGSSSWEMTL